ncbi:T9SS type A sorting domain-containing protein [candidate division KSB1 bacterium]|nr:T9SS type A sorting domain-containing protein [candidate division KSB1 bacterium]
MRSIFRLCFIFIYFLIFISRPAFCHVWLVTSTALEGEGSLDWAIRQAQQHSGADTVQFAIPLSDPNYKEDRGVWEIRMYAPFTDFIDDYTFIDGASQGRNMGETNPDGLEIVLTGPFPYPGEVPPFMIRSAYNKVSGLTMNRFRSEHIYIVGENAHDNVVQNCYIGTDEDGMKGKPNKWNTGIQIREGAHHNLVGGRNNGERNILGSFWYEAIEFAAGAHHNRVLGNYIGVDKTGTGVIGVGWNEYYNTPYVEGKRIDSLYSAIYIRFDSYANEIGGVLPGEGNVICAAGRSGVDIRNKDTDNNSIRGNYIGVGADGETVIPNNEFGVAVWLGNQTGGPAGTIIGGTQAGAGNVISGNYNNGIHIRGYCPNTIIQGNKIGTNANGTRLIANGKNGIYLGAGFYDDFPAHTTIGPGNVLIASAPDLEEESYGSLRCEGAGTSYNTITGNYIGSNKSGSIFSAHNSGILLLNGAHHNTIGPDNVIAKNKKHGIHIRSNGAIANTITRNSIYGNAQKAILLEAGANADLPMPIIFSAESGSISGVTLPNSKVELFADDLHQARLFLGSVKTGSNGSFRWSSNLDQGFVTATVTDNTGNTSELAASRPLPVELSAFEVFLEHSRIHLQWTTMTESNNLGFYIERKQPGGEFEEIGFVPGAGTSNSLLTYHFYDDLQKDSCVFYRLRQVDFDGTLVYSDEVKLQLAQPGRFTLSPAWPNPFNGNTTVRFTVPQPDRVDILVFNIRGEQVRMLTRNLFPAGEYQVQWDGRDDKDRQVGSGVYFIRMTSGLGGIQLFTKVFYLR